MTNPAQQPLPIQIGAFIQGDYRNQWLHGDGLSVYIRKSVRVVDGTAVPCLDLATIEADTPGQGAFTALLSRVEKLDIPLFVENVTAERFQQFFLRRGYTVLHDNGYNKCFYRPGHKPVVWHWMKEYLNQDSRENP